MQHQNKGKVMKHDLKTRVRLIESGEEGVIVGVARYSYSHDSYLIRYKAGDGRQVEVWWSEDAFLDIA